MSDANRKWWLLLLPVFLIATWVVLPKLAIDAVWHDELMTYYQTGTGDFESISIGTLIDRTIKDYSWPLGYYFLILAWDKVSQGSLFIDRMLQMFLGMLTVAVFYQMGKAFFNRRVGFFAAVLLASNAFFIVYMHELRGHMFYLLTTAMALWSYWLLLKDTDLKYRWRQFFFLLSAVLALNTHYVATAALLGVGLYHLLFERTRPINPSGDRAKNWNRITFLGVLSFGIYGPWIGVMVLEVVRRATVFKPVVDTITALDLWFYVFFNGILYIVMLLLALISLRWWQHRSLSFIWFWTIFVIIFNVVTNIWTNFLFHPRHLLLLLIPVSLLLAFMLDKIWRWQPILSMAILVIWIVAGLFYSITSTLTDIIPTQIPTLPLNTIEELQAVSATCVAEDETVIFELVETKHEFIYQVPFFYYFDKFGYRYSNLVQMQNIRDGELQDLYDLSYKEKVSLMTEGQAGIWLFSNPAVSQPADIERFESTLTDEGFMACPTTLNATGFQGRYYTHSAAPNCERIVSCAGQ